VPKTSYLRALTGPPAGNVAVLRPPHKPAWGLSTAFGQHRMGGDLLHEGSLPSSMMRSMGREDHQLATPKVDRQIGAVEPEVQSHPLQRVEVEGIGRAGKRSTEFAALGEGGRDQQVRGLPGETVEPLSPEQGRSSSASSNPAQIPSRQPFSSEDQARLSTGFDQADLKTSASNAAKIERLTAELQAAVRNAGPSSAQFRPLLSNATSTHGATGRADGKTSVHIGTIDVRLAPPAPAPRSAARQPTPAVPPVLSRGFASSYGLRQG
jgi:hypothetical protein